MKYLIIIFLLISCQTVHKAVSDSLKTVDSTSLSRKDTSSISLETILSNSLEVNGIDIEITYQKPDSIQVDPDNLKEIIEHPLSGGDIASVHIHIDSMSNKEVTDIRKDSSSEKEITKTSMKTLDQTHSKVVSKTGIPLWIYIVGGVAILLVIGFLFLKKIIKV